MSMTWSWMTVKLHCEQSDGKWDIYAQQEVDVWRETKAEFLSDWVADNAMFRGTLLDNPVNFLMRTALP